MVDNIPNQVKKRSTLLSNVNNTNHSFGNHQTVMVDNISTKSRRDLLFCQTSTIPSLLWQPSNSNGGQYINQVKKRSTLLSNVNNTNHSFGNHQTVMVDNISTKSRRDLLFCQTSTIPTTPLANTK